LALRKEEVKKGYATLYYEEFHDLCSCGSAGMFGMQMEFGK